MSDFVIETIQHTEAEQALFNRTESERVQFNGRTLAFLPVGQAAQWVAECTEGVREEFGREVAPGA